MRRPNAPLGRLALLIPALCASLLLSGELTPAGATVSLGTSPALAQTGPAAGVLTVPLDTPSPWPEMRHDRRNTGTSPGRSGPAAGSSRPP